MTNNQKPHSATPERLCRRAHEHYERGGFADAQRLWETALEIDPHCANAHFGIGRILYNEFTKSPDSIFDFELPDKMTFHLQAAVDAGMQSEEVYRIAAAAYDRLQQANSAVEVLKKGVRILPGNIELRVSLCRALNLHIKFREARECAQAALELAPHNPKLWEELAFASIMLRSFYPGLHAANRALDLDPHSIRATGYKRAAHLNLSFIRGLN